VIARALSRLASTRSTLGLERGTGSGPEPGLMAAAGSDFDRSIAMFEKLLIEHSGDPLIRRYLADALGLGGMACHMKFTQRSEEAERLYLRAIKLRRDLVRGRAPGDVAGARPRVDDPGERENPLLLAYTVEIVAHAMDDAGRVAEAKSLRRQLKEDFTFLAARLTGPEFQSLRLGLVNQLLMAEGPTTIPMVQQMTLQNAELATIVEPNSADAHNNVAWALVRGPDEPWFDPKRGLEEARKAVELGPKNGSFWNTLGVAAFRTRDWQTAHDALERSIELTGGTAHDWFFLAMTRWIRGDRSEARRSFDQALAVIKPEQKDDPELRRFHNEAATLLGIPVPKAGLKGELTRKAEGPAVSTRK
jgi:tetratricopeptide (TPR) repeat protein